MTERKNAVVPKITAFLGGCMVCGGPDRDGNHFSHDTCLLEVEPRNWLENSELCRIADERRDDRDEGGLMFGTEIGPRFLLEMVAYEAKRAFRRALTGFCTGWMWPEHFGPNAAPPWSEPDGEPIPAQPTTLPMRFGIWLDSVTRQ